MIGWNDLLRKFKSSLRSARFARYAPLRIKSYSQFLKGVSRDMLKNRWDWPAIGWTGSKKRCVRYIDILKNRLVIRPILRPTALGTFSRELDESRDVTYLVQALNKSNSRCKKALRLQLSFSQSPCELHIWNLNSPEWDCKIEIWCKWAEFSKIAFKVLEIGIFIT